MKKNQKVLIGIGILVILAITIILIKGYPFKQDYESCVKTCETADDPYYLDVDCSEYCNCIINQPYTLFSSDQCTHVGKPDIWNWLVENKTQKAVEIAKSTSEVQEFLNADKSDKVSGVVGPVPFNCMQKKCDYKFIVDYSYATGPYPWSKTEVPVVIIEIDASTGEIIGRYSKLKDV